MNDQTRRKRKLIQASNKEAWMEFETVQDNETLRVRERFATSYTSRVRDG